MKKHKMCLLTTVIYTVFSTADRVISDPSNWEKGLVIGIIGGLIFGALYTSLMSFLLKPKKED